MNAIDHFLETWLHLHPGHGIRSVTPLTRAAVAVADALPGVTGSAICVDDGTSSRLPIGCSDEEALLAEQWEYTVGDGPGLRAHSSSSALVAGDHFARHWPIYHHALLGHTPYRAVRAVPLTDAQPMQTATLLLYYGCVDDAHHADLSDIIKIADIIAGILAFSSAEIASQLQALGGSTVEGPLGRRLAVGAAVDCLAAAQRLPAVDALALLRGVAYSRDETIDDTAHHLLSGHLDAAAM